MKERWGIESLVKNMQKKLVSVGMTGITKSIVGKCLVCQKNNPNNARKPLLGTLQQGNTPNDYWQIEFSKLL